MTFPATRSGRLWSIILAGGEGERVKPLVQRWLGRHRPKQYCAFVGSRSMFQHTLDRASHLTPPERTLAVIAQNHQHEALVQLQQSYSGTALVQPSNRDTAAGVYLPLTYIRARNPSATVVLFPSDHFVYPEERFLAVVQQAISAAEAFPDRLVLLGVQPDRLELEYGWIQPGASLAETPDGSVRTVSSFLEKPSAAQADTALRAGALWNTLVLTAKLETLWTIGWECFPDMMALFEQLGQAVDHSDEGRVLESIYQEMPAYNFSSALLQRAAARVAVMELTGVLWSDWGKPERIMDILQRIGRKPAFPVACMDRPFTPIAAMGQDSSVMANTRG